MPRRTARTICCFGPDGLLYFTDPHNWEDDLATKLRTGRVCRTTLDGAVELLCEVPRFPNGIAFGPDDRLYVAQSITPFHPGDGADARRHP